MRCFSGTFVLSITAACILLQANAFSLNASTPPATSSDNCVSRANFIRGATVATLSLFGGTGPPAIAVSDNENGGINKRRNLSDGELKKIITSDVVERSFLASADLTRDIYDEGATFTDEIDTYSLSQWIKGTKNLFVAEGSRVTLVGDVDVTPEKVEFRFDEDLMFRIPFRPIVNLSGTVVLTRDPVSGLITSYKENWDQDVASVLKTAKFK